MPKITDLTADTAPDVADVIPFVDVSAGATEKVTVDNLAASTAFSGRYAPLAGEQVWIPAAAFTAAQGSPVLVTSVTKSPGWLLDSAAAEGVIASVVLPPWWLTYHVDVYGYNVGAGAGAVALALYYQECAEAGTLNPLAAAVSVVPTVRAQDIEDVLTITSSALAYAGARVALVFQRDGTAGSDTLGNDWALAGLNFRRVT